MILFWRGFGFLVAVLVFAFSIGVCLVCEAVYGEAYWENHNWPFSLSLALAAIPLWFIGRHMRKKPARIVIDKLTGQELALNQSVHTFLFIPMEYWAPILLVIGLIYLLT